MPNASSPLRLASLCAGLALLCAAPLSATVIFSDDFSYPDGATSPGGVGTWTHGTGTTSSRPYVSDGKLVLASPASSEGASSRLYTSLGTARSSGSLFVGFDYSFTTFNPSDTLGTLNLFHAASGVLGNGNFASSSTYGALAIDPITSDTIQLGLSSRTNTAATIFSPVFEAGETYRFVVEYAFIDGTTNDEVRFYADGSLVGSITGLDIAPLIFVGFVQPTTNREAHGTVDNFVVATTFAEVAAAIPEPASAATLFGAAGLALAATRRRRRTRA